MELNENIMQIIIRQLNHEATQQEMDELDAWLSEDAAHRQEYDDYVKIWHDSSGLSIQHQFSASEGWEKLQKKIPVPQPVITSPKGRIVSLRRWTVAASIVFIAGLAIFYFYQSSQDSSWQTYTAVNGNERITLPDGSVITLRKGSTLRQANNFGKEDRTTELDGEAFFEVQHNEQKLFKVFTSGAVVEVLGTSFLVRQSGSSNRVVVQSGKVRLADREEKSSEVVLKKGQQAELVNGKLNRDTVANTNYLAWENGQLVFNNTPLQQALQDIGYLYNLKIEIAPNVEASAADITIQAEFNNQSVDQVLEEIQLMTGLKATRDKEKISISQ